MPLPQFYMLHLQSHTTYHNLCTVLTPPPGIEQLLWNGLKFCLQQPLPKPRFFDTMARLTRDIRLKHHWGDTPPDDADGFNPKLYIRSDWNPPNASEPIETALQQFEAAIQQQLHLNRSHQSRRHNLLPSGRRLIKSLKGNTDFIILPTDKNLGPAILERSLYKRRCLQDHLLDEKTYQQLTDVEAHFRQLQATSDFKKLIQKYKKTLPKSEWVYFQRCFNEPRRDPQFYCTPKVHKEPWKTRPIVSCVNSRMGDLSKWVDVQLQLVVHLCPGYLKDSRSLLDRLHLLGKLPPSAVITTADAVSMYTNINTTHALQVLSLWLDLHALELPTHFPKDMVLEATELVMRNNIFQFDDTYWLQLTGTAMGTNLACVYATIYYSYHEETKLLPKSQSSSGLLLYGRLIDDAVLVLDSSKLPNGMTLHNSTPFLEKTMAFGDLQWEAEPLLKEVNFLDLTIRIQPDGSIATKTYVKPMNLHLYIPPRSAHPQGVLKSLVFGNLQRYWIQNSNKDDYITVASAFFGHLLRRGYSIEELQPIFQDAAAVIDRKTNGAATTQRQPRSSNNSIFVHWEYHPNDIGRRDIRQAFNTLLAPALSESRLPHHPVIAYSVPRSLGQCLTKTQLQEAPGQRVSSSIEQLKGLPSQPLAP